MTNNSMGYIKDLTGEFIDHRSGYLGATLVEPTVQTVTVTDQPQWTQVVDQIKSKIVDVQFKSVLVKRLLYILTRSG